MMFPGNCVAIESGIEWIKQRKCVAKTKITKFRFEQRARARERERKRERKIEREMVGDGPLTIWKHTKSSPSFPCISSGLTENIWHDKRQNSPTWIIQRKKFFQFRNILVLHRDLLVLGKVLMKWKHSLHPFFFIWNIFWKLAPW